MRSEPIPFTCPKAASTVPAVVIRCAVGQPPLVVCECHSAADVDALTVWFDQHEDYFQLVTAAIEIAERERAA